MSTLSEPELYTNDPEKMWLKVKAANRLNGKRLSTVQHLAKWREQTAQTENRPRNRLMRDDTLLDIAKMQPNNIGALSRIRGLHERFLKKHGHSILELVHKAASEKPQPKPEVNIPDKPTPHQETIIEFLTAIVHLRAIENELSATQLASKKQIQKLVMGSNNSELLRGWRKALIGDELVNALNGKLSVSINNQQIEITDRA